MLVYRNKLLWLRCFSAYKDTNLFSSGPLTWAGAAEDCRTNCRCCRLEEGCHLEDDHLEAYRLEAFRPEEDHWVAHRLGAYR